MTETIDNQHDLDELVEFLEEQRDKYEEMSDEAREDGDTHGKIYGHARYHAYADVLAWLYGEDWIQTFK